ncbi:hypothetical protein E4U41_005820 [Claviceps citrina]|nr:hypothetical protein E4U41_005820 [Claviceps citrina]
MLSTIRRAAAAAAARRHPALLLPPSNTPTTATTRTTSTTTRRRLYATTTNPPPQAPDQASSSSSSMTPAEEAIAARLRQHLHPTELLVQDVSGGCGSMYAIDIASPAFRGVGMLKQQRMVNSALGDLMRGWHGMQLNTRASE